MSTPTTAHVHAATGRGLQRLLGTLDSHAFLQDNLGERMLHMNGQADRWADLFSWHDLEVALNSGLVSYPRARLMMQGPEVDPTLYTYERAGRQWPDSRRCQEMMAKGATLILVNVEGLTPHLDAFVRDLERDLCAGIRVDVVATTASVPGLKLHWDNAECFNIQLDGEKDWKVVRPERLHPLTATHRFPERKDAVTTTAPDVPPTWSGTVARGDLLYLPRGWWHVVTPRVSPSLHLSIAADIPTLTDYLRWLAVEAARLDAARRPLPVCRTAEERRVQMTDALAELRTHISHESLETYIDQATDFAPGRPEFALPRSATTSGAAQIDGGTVLRLQSLRPLTLTLEKGTVALTWREQTLKFPESALPALIVLDQRRAMTLDELGQHTDRMLAQVLAFTLLNSGLLAVSARPTPNG